MKFIERFTLVFRPNVYFKKLKNQSVSKLFLFYLLVLTLQFLFVGLIYSVVIILSLVFFYSFFLESGLLFVSPILTEIFYSFFSSFAVFLFVALFAILILMFVLQIIYLFIFSIFSHGILKLFGGGGKFADTFMVSVYTHLPLFYYSIISSLSSLLLFIPIIGEILFFALIPLFMSTILYVILFRAIGFSQKHKLDIWKCVIPDVLFIFGVLFLFLIFGITLLISSVL